MIQLDVTNSLTVFSPSCQRACNRLATSSDRHSSGDVGPDGEASGATVPWEISTTPSRAAALRKSASSVARGKPSRCANSRGGIVYRQPVSTGEPEYCVFVRRPVHSESKQRNVQQKGGRVGFRDPLPALVHDQDISHFGPPQAGYHALFGTHAVESQAGVGVVFVVECPASRDRCIQNECHQDFRPSSRADSTSLMVILPVCLLSFRMAARALSISSCRRSTSRTIRAMRRPWRVIISVSPRSTSSRSWGR